MSDLKKVPETRISDEANNAIAGREEEPLDLEPYIRNGVSAVGIHVCDKIEASPACHPPLPDPTSLKYGAQAVQRG